MSTPMHYGAKPNRFEFARQLRISMTPQELKLWNVLKRSQLEGFKFRNQHPFGRFIADFYCHKVKLVIEIDGGYHTQKMQKEYDAWRNEVMNDYGIQILRFTNEEIDTDFENVVETIKKVLLHDKSKD